MNARRARGGAIGLAASQRWLFERVTSPEPSMLAEDASRVVGGGLPAAARVEVYRHAYFARLRECLADDYPALAHALGAAAFAELCDAYISACPPQSPSLNFFGAELPSFCERLGVGSCAAPQALELTVELARLEWAVVEAIHADATSTLDPAALGALEQDQWARARLVPSPALRLLRGDYPVHAYYRAFLEGERPGQPAPERSAVAVCRRDDDIWRLPLEAPLADLLERLMAGQALAAALDAISSDAANLAAGAVERAFGDWVGCGFFSALVVD